MLQAIIEFIKKGLYILGKAIIATLDWFRNKIERLIQEPGADGSISAKLGQLIGESAKNASEITLEQFCDLGLNENSIVSCAVDRNRNIVGEIHLDPIKSVDKDVQVMIEDKPLIVWANRR